MGSELSISQVGCDIEKRVDFVQLFSEKLHAEYLIMTKNIQ